MFGCGVLYSVVYPINYEYLFLWTNKKPLDRSVLVLFFRLQVAFMQEQKSSSRRMKFCRMMRFIFFIQPDVVLFDPIKILVVKRRRKNQKENGFLFQSIISTITHKLLKEPFAEEAKDKLSNKKVFYHVLTITFHRYATAKTSNPRYKLAFNPTTI